MNQYQIEQAVSTIIKGNPIESALSHLIEAYWSGEIETRWHPEEGFFSKSAEDIARGLLDDAEDKAQAMSRLNFYINRAGSNLSPSKKKTLEKAKAIISNSK